MTSKQALLKIVPIVLAASLGSYGGSVIAASGTTPSDQPKVDCKKDPEHRDCMAKSG
jgi:hypothetical protein